MRPKIMSYLKNLPKAFAEIVKDFEPLQAVAAWKKVAGPVIGKHAEFLGIFFNGKKVILQLSVKDPVWRQEIQFETKEILASMALELKKHGWHEEKIPTEILFQAVLPLQSRNPHFRRDKKLIKT